MADNNNNTNLAQVMNGGAPVKTEVASTSTEAQSGANAFAAALGSSSGQQEFSGGYTRNSTAGFDSPKNKTEILKEQEKAQELEAHKAALATAEQEQQIIWDGAKEETLQEIAALQKTLLQTSAGGGARKELFVTEEEISDDTTETINGGAGIKIFLQKMISELKRIIKMFKDRNQSWATAFNTKKKKQGAKNPGGKMAGAKTFNEVTTVIHGTNHESASIYAE